MAKADYYLQALKHMSKFKTILIEKLNNRKDYKKGWKFYKKQAQDKVFGKLFNKIHGYVN